jgi:hypothetical protein
MAADYFIGLDPGRDRDPCALAVVERVQAALGGGEGRPVFAVRHLRRWPLHTSYAAVAAELATLVRTPPLCWPVLVVDQTGVGQAVVDFLARAGLAARLEGVVITSGRRSRRSAAGTWHVPKKELVGSLERVLRSRRLRVAALPERAALVRELSAFRVTITAAARETFGAGRERDHDDLVLAVALALWRADRPDG